MWTYAISKQLLPIIVLPLSFVPRFKVQYSRIIVEFPIINSDFSFSNFKSWGSSPITAPLKILHPFPIVVKDFI